MIDSETIDADRLNEILTPFGWVQEHAVYLAQNFERLDALVHQILDTGAILKDINTGLLDLPSLRDDHEVYLCWRHGEQRIEYWHEIDAGFAGREPLDSL